jgi:hypothetical protein
MIRTPQVQDAPQHVPLTGLVGAFSAGNLQFSAAAVPDVNTCATTAAGPTAAVPERAHFLGTAAVESVVRERVA